MVESGPAGQAGPLALQVALRRPHPAHDRADHGLGSVSLAPFGGCGMGVRLVEQ
jgi:hypothetical protein